MKRKNNAFVSAAVMVLSIVLFASCSSEKKEKAGQGNGMEMATADTIVRENPYKNSKVETSIYSNDTTSDKNLGGFGYNILIDGKMYVHQPHIPAVAGNKGFASAEAAAKAASLVSYKIRNNIMPPSISEHELDSIGALQ